MRCQSFTCIAALVAVLVAGCGDESQGKDGTGQAATPTDAPGEPAEPAVAPEPDEPRFDIESIPLSDAPLGEFPYFDLPVGYHVTDKLSSTLDAGTFPFWVGDHYVGVQGRIYQANIRADEGKIFSTLEVEQNVEHVIDMAGGVRIAEGVIPRKASSEVLTRTFASDFRNGLCWPSEPVRTYVVRRTDKDIWVHACTYGGIGAAWVIAETGTVEPTATLLPKSEMQKALDALGKATVQINFASDSARILEASHPQLDAIATLLQDDVDLGLLVVGHTDDTGTRERNQLLSEQRALAVVDALAERGIHPARLAAEGRGRSEPVASNDSAEGRATNRRVELVRVAAAEGED